MATTYSAADGECLSLLSRVMAEHHPKLAEAGVKVDVLMAENPNGDAVKLHGAPAIAVVRVVRLKDRVKGMGDAEITIDLFAWNQMSERHREATLFHELEHLVRVERKKPEEGEPAWATDDIGRPKLKTRPGDWDSGDGFVRCIQVYGDHAVEFSNIRRAWALAQAAREQGSDDGEGGGDADSFSELEEAA